LFYTSCCSVVVVLSLRKGKVVSSSPAHTGCVKPKTFKRGTDCSFAKSTAFRSENQGSFGYDLKHGGHVSQWWQSPNGWKIAHATKTNKQTFVLHVYTFFISYYVSIVYIIFCNMIRVKNSSTTQISSHKDIPKEIKLFIKRR
jgi:hypothetical protein